MEAGRYKEKVGAPLMLVGGIRSFEIADRLVNEGTADYISLCRPLIREPDLVNRWRSGDRRKATAFPTTSVLSRQRRAKDLCVVEKKEKQKSENE